jgi:S-formylglutathione hydrolase FrmB
MTFRVAFPKAAEVVLSGQWSKDPTPMSRDAEGTWSVTLDSIPPGVYEYSFVVDGVRMIDPGNPAIIGLSMGGGQALTVGLNHTDTFGWVGGFSASPPAGESVSGALERADQTNQHLKWLWIGCGKDDFLLARNEEFISRLNEAGINHEWVLTEGDHSWPVWRGYLADVLPQLFR